MYRLPCRTEYNAEYNADYNAQYNADYNADYNTEYNAISASKLQYREYPPIDPDSDSVIPSYTTTMSTDDCKSTSQLSPSNRCSLRSYMRLVTGGATALKRGG